MSFFPDTASMTWGIAALATSGVIIRPWRLPEGVWAVLGALTLVLLGLLPWRDALSGIRNGLDVYLFLIGMMRRRVGATGRAIRLAGRGCR